MAEPASAVALATEASNTSEGLQILHKQLGLVTRLTAARRDLEGSLETIGGRPEIVDKRERNVEGFFRALSAITAELEGEVQRVEKAAAALKAKF